MNYFYNLFKSNNIINDNEENLLINNKFDNINNMCMSINSNNSNDLKTNREYDIDFINYNKIKKHNFKLYIYENNLQKHNIIKSTNYYNNISGDYYIEFIKDLELFNNKGKLSIVIKDEFEKQICILDFNYKINNNFEYNSDIIKLNLNNSNFNIYLKKNKSNEFYIYKFIYNKYNN